MEKEDLSVEAGKALQSELAGMPPKQVVVSFNGMKTTIEGDLAEELRDRQEASDLLGMEFSISASGYVKKEGTTWLEGDEGRRPEITIQVTSVKVKPK